MPALVTLPQRAQGVALIAAADAKERLHIPQRGTPVIVTLPQGHRGWRLLPQPTLKSVFDSSGAGRQHL
ncbi:hypothetical protein NDU88_003033 [Pleurodeles waltl]|uniref:Uncharacterized protein n=1 Tax=Pleurodeles waltl TaxID=8319 RepID=A0AAV7M2R9_PLEWA|nr:hypothetical protein NDU88_003033 [Pleurodeles waltl]